MGGAAREGRLKRHETWWPGPPLSELAGGCAGSAPVRRWLTLGRGSPGRWRGWSEARKRTPRLRIGQGWKAPPTSGGGSQLGGREAERPARSPAHARQDWSSLGGPRPLGRSRGCSQEARGAGGAVRGCCACGWVCSLDAGQGCFRRTAVRVLGCGGGMANVQVAVRVRPLSKR